MDWFKVKVKHVEFDFGAAPAEVFKAWICVMSYVSACERHPVNNELEKRYGITEINALKKHLEDRGETLDFVIEKVLEDVEKCVEKKGKDRRYMRQWRSKYLRKPLRKALRKPLSKACVRAQIREEKIREDIADVFPHLKNKEFEELLNSYLKGRKKKATEHAKELILKDLHKHDINIAKAMLEESIKQGWQGIFPLKEKQGAKWNDL